jgi:hypothetical protein
VTTIDPDEVSRRRVYDSRVRELVCATGSPDLFPGLKIPRSTIRGWLRSEFKTAVGVESVTRAEIELYSEIAKLRRCVRVLHAVVFLLSALVRVTGCRLDGERLPDGGAKARILNAIDKATKMLALGSAFEQLQACWAHPLPVRSRPRLCAK